MNFAVVAVLTALSTTIGGQDPPCVPPENCTVCVAPTTDSNCGAPKARRHYFLDTRLDENGRVGNCFYESGPRPRHQACAFFHMSQRRGDTIRWVNHDSVEHVVYFACTSEEPWPFSQPQPAEGIRIPPHSASPPFSLREGAGPGVGSSSSRLYRFRYDTRVSPEGASGYKTHQSPPVVGADD